MDENKITPIEGLNVVVKKKSIGQKFKETFVSKDFSSTLNDVATNVAVPALKRVASDVITNFVNGVLFGNQFPTNGGFKFNASNWNWGNWGTFSTPSYFNYSGVTKPTTPTQTQQIFRYNELEVQPGPGETMADAEKNADLILRMLHEQLDRFKKVRITDYYELCGKSAPYTYNNYGWTSLAGADKVYTGSGYLIKMPAPVPLF